MNNTRFATAIHILTLLAAKPGEWMSSEYIAGSINLNPALVRKELSVLNEAGLVISKKGKEGGVQLGKPGEKIFLSDIFMAVKNTELLGKKNLNTNPACPIGKNIVNELDTLFAETDAWVVKSLRKKTLKSFLDQFI